MAGTESVNTEAQTCAGPGPLKGTTPVNNSNITTPSDQISVRASTSEGDEICSGDMYCGEPTLSVGLVCDRMWRPRSCFETPKSTILITELPSGSLAQNKFSGLRSR